MSYSRKPATTPQKTMVVSRTRSNIHPNFNVKGIISLSKNRLLLFGQARDNENKKMGYLEVRNGNTLSVIENVKTNIGDEVWCAVETSPNDCLLFSNNFDDKSGFANVIRSQTFDTTIWKTDNLAGYCKGCTWTNVAAKDFNPPVPPGAYLSYDAWRIADNCVESRANNRDSPQTYSVNNAAQYITVAPNAQHIITGDGEKQCVSIHSKRESKESDYSVSTSLTVDSQHYQCSGWFSNSINYFIATQNKTLQLRKINCTAVVTFHLDTHIHAAVTLPDDPTVIISHTDGSVRRYDAWEALVKLQQEKSCDEKVSPVEIIIPPQTYSYFCGIFTFTKNNVKRDIATTHNALVCHERGTQKLEHIALNRNANLHIPPSLMFLAPIITDGPTGIVSQYARSLPKANLQKKY